jgi:hypothetical protein
VAFDASNTTLTLLGLELQLPRCTFCSLADALEAQSAGVPAPGKPAHALPRAAAPQAVRAAGAAGCHRARGRARRRGAAGRTIAGGERDGHRRGRAPRRRAPGARRDAASAPARGTQLEHLLERALPHLERAVQTFESLRIKRFQMGFFVWGHESLMSTWDFKNPMSTWSTFS